MKINAEVEKWLIDNQIQYEQIRNDQVHTTIYFPESTIILGLLFADKQRFLIMDSDEMIESNTLIQEFILGVYAPFKAKPEPDKEPVEVKDLLPTQAQLSVIVYDYNKRYVTQFEEKYRDVLTQMGITMRNYASVGRTRLQVIFNDKKVFNAFTKYFQLKIIHFGFTSHFCYKAEDVEKMDLFYINNDEGAQMFSHGLYIFWSENNQTSEDLLVESMLEIVKDTFNLSED